MTANGRQVERVEVLPIRRGFQSSNTETEKDGVDFEEAMQSSRCCCCCSWNHGVGDFGINWKQKRLCITSEKVCWWEPPLDSLSMDFCHNTSLHGLKYIGQSKRHISERLFWFFAFLTGCFAAGYLITDVWRKYNESPVIVSFEPVETNIDQIPFPAVTICNMNKVLRTKAEQYIREAKADFGKPEVTSAERNLYYLDHVCSSSKSFTKRFNFSISSVGTMVDENLIKKIAEEVELQNSLIRNETMKCKVHHGRTISQRAVGDSGKSGSRLDIRNFLKTASQSCGNMIPLCTWKDKIENCSEIFRPVETDFGKCCTFNMVPTTLLEIFRSDERDNQTEIDLWNRTDLEETWLSKFTENGSRVVESIRPRRQSRAGKSYGLSFLLDPALDEYFCTTSDSLGFRLSTHLSTENPHVIDYGFGITPNSEVFISVKPEITKADESIHGYPKEKRKCYFPYEYNLTYYQFYSVSNCIDECAAEFTQEACNCVRYYMPRDDSRALCGPEKFNCAEDVKRLLSEMGYKANCSHCWPSCTEILYLDATTTTPLQGGNLWMDSDKILSKWSKSNVSIVHIYLGQDGTYARIRKELYGTTDLFANTGGLMGLCLGFSGLSMVEVLYYLTLRAWCRKRRKRTIGARVANKFRDLWDRVKALQTNKDTSRKELNNTKELDESTPMSVPSKQSNLIISPLGKVKDSLGHVKLNMDDHTNITYAYSSPLAPIHEISPFYSQKWQLGRTNPFFSYSTNEHIN